ncbi:class I SAM-dependent methyltransferase [Rhodococcus maanshanensis]|uniref:Methyltransferase domain-containing protein n=1 Tax=Rhodococcus maanshanensis TaxID=183556 RepID=A0A1H7Q8B9_9NOCA|nr:class I SAM-dependent methyltransferase [Rhodococcus maanshanensis]SEL44340.1 Methyltransferase domain-containing protein [Rhodococcus maanshanensis]
MAARPEEWASGEDYQRYMGRWSRLAAVGFLRGLPPLPAAAWCDVGCGTGSLTQAILAGEQPARVLGVDPSVGYLAAARARVSDERVEFEVGSAAAIPAADREFDRVVSALVLNFVPDPGAALAEMTRVARPAGLVAAYVWDYADGMDMIRLFWDAAVELDPAAAPLDEGRRFPLCRPEPLRELFASAGLTEVRVGQVSVDTVFVDFEDFWRPFLGGQGPAPGYCTSLTEDHRAALRESLRATTPRTAAGAVALRARAWTVRGRRP